MTPWWAGRKRVRSVNSFTTGSLARYSMTLATSSGFLVYLMATSAAPPCRPEQAAVPQGEPVATQSKASPILVERFATCQLPE